MSATRGKHTATRAKTQSSSRASSKDRAVTRRGSYSSRASTSSRRKGERTRKRKPSARDASEVTGKSSFFARHRISLSIVFVVVVALAILYPVGQSYYQSLRETQRTQAELDAVNARNAEIQESNDALSTDEGIENEAVSELGWVEEGESAAIVTNADESSEGSKLPEQVDPDEIQAPQTWYYRVLDAIFFVHV